MSFNSMHRLVIVTGALCTAVAAQADTTLYEQPFAETANGGYFSSTLASYLQYDSFTLSAAGTIKSASWYGVDLNELLVGATTINPTSFQIGIYTDDGTGKPGSLLSSATIGNSGNQVDTGQQLMGLKLYQFSGNFSTPLNVEAGKKYWFQAIDPTDNTDWFWASGAGGDGVHVGNIGATVGTFDDDMSFKLSGTSAVPEPGTLLALGLGSLAFLRRNRKTR